MTPTNTPSVPWWQTLLAGIANAAISALLGHYLGPVAGASAAAVGTGAALKYQVKK